MTIHLEAGPGPEPWHLSHLPPPPAHLHHTLRVLRRKKEKHFLQYLRRQQDAVEGHRLQGQPRVELLVMEFILNLVKDVVTLIDNFFKVVENVFVVPLHGT